MDDVSVALARSPSRPEIVKTSLHAVRFNGDRTAHIPAYADIWSDSIGFPLPNFANVAVTFHVLGPTGEPTYHPAAFATSFYNAGHYRPTDAAALSEKFTAYDYIAGIDVQNAAAAGVVVAFGDSITDGAGSKVDANHRWPNYLAERILASPTVPRLGVLNAGIGGNRILRGGGYFGRNALARFDTDVLAQSNVRSLIVLLGVNDIQQTPHENVSGNIIGGLKQIVLRAHAAGIRATCATITPYNGFDTYSAAGEATRQRVNAWIHTNNQCDAVADFDAAVRDPQEPTRLQPRFDSGDHLHPNDDAYSAMAAAVDLQRL